MSERRSETIITNKQKKIWISFTAISWLVMTVLLEILNWSILPAFASLCACTALWPLYIGLLGNAIVAFFISGTVIAFVMFSLGRWIIPAGLFILARRNSKK